MIDRDFFKKIFLSTYVVPVLYFVFRMITKIISHAESGDLMFETAVFIYFIIVLSFLYLILFKTDINILTKHGAMIVFVSASLILLFFIPFGVDLTDEGEQMSTAWFMFHGNFYHSYNIYKIGSWLVNGLWLSIAGVPLLIWERIGGVIVVSLTAVFTYKTINLIFKDPVKSVTAVMVGLIFVMCHNHPETKIDHSNLPTLVMFIGFYFYTRFYFKPDDRFGYLNLTLSSLMMAVSVGLRVPHIVIFVFPFLHFTAELLFKRCSLKEFVYRIGSYYGLFIVAVAIGVGVLTVVSPGKISSIIGTFISKLTSDGLFKNPSAVNFADILQSDKIYSQSYYLYLASKYLVDCFRLGFCIIFSCVLMTLFYLADRFMSPCKKNKYISVLFYLLAAGVFAILLLAKGWMWYMLPLALFVIYPVFSGVFKLPLRSGYFIVWGWILFFVSFVGSNNSFRHSVPSGAVFILCSFVVGHVLCCKDQFSILRKEWIYRFMIVFFTAMVVVGGYKRFFDSGKRDFDLVDMGKMYRSPELWGLLGRSERVEAIDAIIAKLKEQIPAGKSAAVVGSMPLLNYLINREYPWENPWTEQIAPHWIDIYVGKGITPDFIVYSKYNGREPHWPVVRSGAEPRDAAVYDVINKLIHERYVSIYENELFVIYKLK